MSESTIMAGEYLGKLSPRECERIQRRLEDRLGSRRRALRAWCAAHKPNRPYASIVDARQRMAYQEAREQFQTYLRGVRINRQAGYSRVAEHWLDMARKEFACLVRMDSPFRP